MLSDFRNTHRQRTSDIGRFALPNADADFMNTDCWQPKYATPRKHLTRSLDFLVANLGRLQTTRDSAVHQLEAANATHQRPDIISECSRSGVCKCARGNPRRLDAATGQRTV